MTDRKFCSELKLVVVVVIGRLVGIPCRDGSEVPKDPEGTGDARRAIEACRMLSSGAGDVDRSDGDRIGIERDGVSEELSPLSAMLYYSVVPPDQGPGMTGVGRGMGMRKRGKLKDQKIKCRVSRGLAFTRIFFNENGFV